MRPASAPWGLQCLPPTLICLRMPTPTKNHPHCRLTARNITLAAIWLGARARLWRAPDERRKISKNRHCCCQTPLPSLCPVSCPQGHGQLVCREMTRAGVSPRIHTIRVDGRDRHGSRRLLYSCPRAKSRRLGWSTWSNRHALTPIVLVSPNCDRINPGHAHGRRCA